VHCRPTHAGVSIELTDDESALLRVLLLQMTQLLEPDEAAPEDPLAVLVGMDAEASRPDDPALLRLLPDAYGNDDDSSDEFRRFTERELRSGKLVHARAVLDALPPGGGTVLLSRDDVDHWVLAVNDIRLVLGARLAITDDDWELPPDADEAEAATLAVFEFLGHLLGWLIDLVEPRSAGGPVA
jgi:hypothetical protein